MKIGWRVYFGLLLIALSALLYLVHFSLFHDLAYIEIYGLGDVAFLPIEVLLVVLVVDWVISRQEKRSQLAKLNMVIGVYFSEVGTPLLKAFSDFDPLVGKIRDELLVKGTWTSRNFAPKTSRIQALFREGRPQSVAIPRKPAQFSSIRADVLASAPRKS
jgi:hypothetical protein